MGQTGELKKVGRSWFVRYYEDGRRRMTKLGAVEDYPKEKDIYPTFQEFMAGINKPDAFRPNTQMTVKQFVTEFLKEHADSVRPNTLRGYYTVWNEHIESRLGTKKLVSVRTHDVDRILRNIATANPEMRAATLARIKSFVHLVFEESIRKDVFTGRNPAASAKVVSKNKTEKEMGAYTDAEAKAIVDCVPEPYSVIFSICRWTGLRRSEVLGLKWSDYEGSQIQIRRSLGFGLKGEMVLSAPKTEKSQAPVHVVPELKTVLNHWKLSRGKKLDKTIINDCWMFQASESRTRRDDKEHGDLLDAASMPPMNPANILRVVLPKLAEKKLEWKGWHGFRRGVATELHREGVQDIVIQRALRHSNVAVTQESYIRDVPEVVSDALEKLAKRGTVGHA